MKTAKFKLLAAALVIATMSFSSMSITKADEIVLPVVTKPAVLQEGTQRSLTPAQIAELLPWAKDSKVFLIDLLASLQGLASQDKVDQLVTGITTVVGESSPKNLELLMRYVLNRGLIINEILDREMGADVPGTIDAKIRVLVASIQMAITYYDADLNMMTKKTAAPYATFGYEYFSFLSELNKSIFDASAQYNIYRTSLEWFQWDLYRDLNNTSFASQIVKINNSLKIYPTKKLTDAQSINFIRQMKGLAQSLDIRLALAKTEQERQAIKKKQEEDEYVRLNGPIIPVVQVISMPKVGGINFSSKSDKDGICILMGYEKAIPGENVTDGSVYGMSIVVNKKGVVLHGDIVDSSVGAVMSQVTCANRVINRNTNLEIAKVTNLKLKNDIIVSSLSKENGVCKLLGYERGVEQSGRQDGAYRGVMAIIDEKGNSDTANFSTSDSGARMSEVICVNKLSSAPDLSIVKVNKPKYDGHNISHDSNVDGVCRKMGFSRGIKDSIESDGSVFGIAMTVDVLGAVISTVTVDR